MLSTYTKFLIIELETSDFNTLISFPEGLENAPLNIKYFQSQIHGKILNRMFGGGQCGSTALALMNMIPMPFEQLSQNTDYGRPV